jgi:hypothetical protein
LLDALVPKGASRGHSRRGGEGRREGKKAKQVKRGRRERRRINLWADELTVTAQHYSRGHAVVVWVVI